MDIRNCREMLEARWAEGKFVCVGLDPDLSKILKSDTGAMRNDTLLKFSKRIVEQTHDHVCAYKPNSAFYEALGDEGWKTLRDTIKMINDIAPKIPVILDAKRGDIGNTAEKYAEAAFEWFNADAITLNPYLGMSELSPFLSRKDKMGFVLCKTSNKGAGEFQDVPVATDWAHDGSAPLYQYMAFQIAKKWNENNNVGLVVGATYPVELKMVRQLAGDMPILIPGIGAQGGEVESSVKAGKNSKGTGMIFNSSRGIIYADDPRAETLKLHTLINQCR